MSQLSMLHVGRRYTLACTHSFCTTCAGDFVKHNINARQVAKDKLWCPDVGCKVPLRPHDVQGCLQHLPDAARLYQKYEDFAMRVCLERDKDGRHCPGRGCDFVFFIDNDNEDEQQQQQQPQKFDCPKCHGSFCLSCKEQWHVGTCEAEAARRRAAGRTDGDVELQRWAAQVGAKQCPSCKNLVARTDGCNAMTCRCGITFCWQCTCQVKTLGLGEKPKAGSHYCSCNDWGVAIHRNQPAGQGVNRAAGPNRPDRL